MTGNLFAEFHVHAHSWNRRRSERPSLARAPRQSVYPTKRRHDTCPANILPERIGDNGPAYLSPRGRGWFVPMVAGSGLEAGKIGRPIGRRAPALRSTLSMMGSRQMKPNENASRSTSVGGGPCFTVGIDGGRSPLAMNGPLPLVFSRHARKWERTRRALATQLADARTAFYDRF